MDQLLRQHDRQRLVAAESGSGEAGENSSGIYADFSTDELIGRLDIPEQSGACEQAGVC